MIKKVEHSEMRCKKCGYDLRGQEENRCPECDTEFHPDDPTTFLTASVSGRRYIMRVVIGIILFVIPLLVANDDLIKAIPPSMRFIFFVSPIMMASGGLGIMVRLFSSRCF